MDVLLWMIGEVLHWLVVCLTLGYFGRKPHRHGVDWGDACLTDEKPPAPAG